jgi:hypothetical protein
MQPQPLTELGGQTLEQDVADYLTSKRRRLTDASYKGYRAALRELAEHFAGRDLADFELPAGATLRRGLPQRPLGSLVGAHLQQEPLDRARLLRVAGPPRPPARRPDAADRTRQGAAAPPLDVHRDGV